jgi:UDP:flavonoid glycosyltransferase YjiC (YdhE family)
MRILIPTIGTRGDVQPYIALSQGLIARDHEVIIATHPYHRELVESYQVPFAPIGPDVDLGQETAKIHENAWHWIVGFQRVMRFSFGMLDQVHQDILALSKDINLMIISHTGAGSIEADQLGVANLSVTLFPQAIPADDPNQNLGQRVLSRIAGAGMGLLMERPLNRIRRRLGVGPMGPEGITSRILNLVPVSPLVAPRNPLWDPRHRVTGYWFASEPPGWQAPAQLEDFLNGGPPPVVISLGAMAVSGDKANQAAKITLDAVQQAGIRAVIQGWGEVLQGFPLPETITLAGSVPHNWLLDQAGALIHHGGFGTTAAGLRAGIPALVVPHIIDQFMWGQRVYDLGVGPQPIPRARMTVDTLSLALRQLLDNEPMRNMAKRIGEQICSENGIGKACELIELEFSR